MSRVASLPSDGRKKKKMKPAMSDSSKLSSTELHHHHQSGEKIKFENVSGGGYKTKLMDPVKRALHNDPEKS